MKIFKIKLTCARFRFWSFSRNSDFRPRCSLLENIKSRSEAL